ncbi:SDR family oxidoreductase [Propionivibrio sp.]|uniref:SDR family oxidoreductase n=1 Tax=Propionivibrio sp. TaxID=2212460 RepID=UPI0025E0B7EF|nr:SDR family oxidoreductase [Propionivibrio sp.]MBK7355051.1 SDR family oxidoreductase [Propionivibrio sp.]MBK8402421.1 SDR family oxidoreductase [Propionivibrio sp.]MBK8743575.1 SDR family oxidoreductase [Propionivibrio sp.]MBK8892879.1 SDR family oxidoreductase [Propionivibrio sp.]
MQNLLIVGCGDVARRTLPRLLGHYRVYALLRDLDQFAFWRERGVRPIHADLDCASSLQRISGLADIVLHFAPPTERGTVDVRMRRLLAALVRGKRLPQRLIYISTSGVYGDCGGEMIDETRRPRPTSERAMRRIDAERQLRRFGRRNGVRVCILRAPGIYAAERLPLERLKRGVLALRPEDDVFTNHIHADDLAMLSCAALRYGLANRSYNATDDSSMMMGEYFDLVADRFGLSRPPRVSRSEAQQRLSALQLSFMGESRRIENRRIKKELRAKLRYPLVADGVNAAWQEGSG